MTIAPATEKATDRWVPHLDFAARLALVRHRMGWNIKQAAVECGVSPQTWRGWELEHRLPHNQLAEAARISRVTGVDRDWLLEPLMESNRRCIQITDMDTTPPPTGQRRIGRSVPDLVRPPHMTRLTGGLPGSGDDQSTRRPVRLSKPVIG